MTPTKNEKIKQATGLISKTKILSLQHTILNKSYIHIIPKVERYRRTERENYKAERGD